MTDYSQWLESVKMGHGGLIPLLIVFVLAIMGTIALNFMSDSIGDTRFGVSAVLTSTLLLVFIIVGILVKFCLPRRTRPRSRRGRNKRSEWNGSSATTDALSMDCRKTALRQTGCRMGSLFTARSS